MDQKPVVDTDLSSSSVRFVCGSSFTLFLKDLWLFFSSFLSLVKKSQPAMSTIIWKEDWWLTIDVPVLSRQQRLIQLWGKHKHVDYNNDGITSAIRRGRKERGGRRVTRITVTEEDRWRPGQTVEEDMGISTQSFFFFFHQRATGKQIKVGLRDGVTERESATAEFIAVTKTILAIRDEHKRKYFPVFRQSALWWECCTIYI